MRKEEITRELEKVLGELLAEGGFELIEVIYRFEGRGMVLRVLADRPEGGITIDECAGLNSEISKILEEKNIIQERFVLEVCSPGLDRPLKGKKDFIRNLNSRVKFFLSEPVHGKMEIDGIIVRADDRSVSVDVQGNTVDIDYSIINKARQIIE